MELNGALSNPRVTLELWKFYHLFVTLLTRDSNKRKEPEIHPRCGEIVDTVEKLLTSAMHIGGIQRAVEERLGGSVSSATVEDLLYKHSRSGRILKVRRGMYASPSSGLYRSPPIDETIVDVLRMAGKPMKLKDIHARCEIMLGGPVSYNAVKSCVSHCAGTKIFKVRYGWYALSLKMRVARRP